MKKIRSMLLAFVCAVVWMSILGIPAQAEEKVTTAKNTALINVMNAPAVSGIWEKKGGAHYFRTDDGTKLKRQWISYQGKVYYLGAKGKRIDGWVRYRENTYFLRKKKGAVTGWFTKKGKTYYFGPDGVLYRGMQSVDGAQYYFGEKTGAVQSGWLTIGKHRYFFDRNTHQMKKDCWVKTNKKHYYVNKKGRKKKEGWLTLGDKKYYLDDKGARVTGERYIDGKGCFFKKNGVYDPTVEVKLEADPSKPMVALTFDDGRDRILNACLTVWRKITQKRPFSWWVRACLTIHPQ